MNWKVFKQPSNALPFALSIVGLLFQAVGVAVREISFDSILLRQKMSKNLLAMSWVSFFFDLALVIFIVSTINEKSTHHYHTVICNFLILALVLIIQELDAVIYGLGTGSDLGNGLSCAGDFLLAISFFIWVILIGSDKNSWVHSKFKSMNMDSVVRAATLPMSPRKSNDTMKSYDKKANRVDQLRVEIPDSSANDSRYVTLAAKTPIVTPNTNTMFSSSVNQTPVTTLPLHSTSSFASPENPVRVITLYNYTANPADPNEMSFEKGEFLQVIDNKGKWWTAQKKDGTMGITPSNYLRIC